VKTLVIGRTGQLAQSLASLAPSDAPGPTVLAGRDRCDLRDAESLHTLLAAERPGVVVNAAAWTDVEGAERDPAGAMRVNGEGVGVLAQACLAQGARLLHVSSDYVFDGSARTPYGPRSLPAPLNAYGVSKLEGERRIAALDGLDALIVRASWLYSAVGKNFLLTMLHLFRTRGGASVVDDQIGSPTSARSLARALWAAVRTPGARGIAHYADAGQASWYEFALAIARGARRHGLLDRDAVVTPIPSREFPQLARRPAFSVLEAEESVRAWGIERIEWPQALDATLGELTRG
jgi:dTDP-4-dehydrorhamnose reductase